jgi:AAA+ ATPase superfamily predicted ATPase
MASVRRESELTRITQLLTSPGPGLSVCGISGAGGVGKSYLLQQALEAVDLEALGIVQLSVDGSNPQMRGDFFGILEQLFRRNLNPKSPHRDYFPHVREVARLHRELGLDAARELEKAKAPDAVKRRVSSLLKAGHMLNRAVPMTREYLDLAAFNTSDEETHATLDEAWRFAAELKAFSESSGVMRKLLGLSTKDRVRRELYKVTAEEAAVDLSAALGALKTGPVLKRLAQQSIEGAKRLLIVLDDYEVLSPLLGDFLVGALVPELAAAGFETLLIVLCRDDLEATHVGWSQHCKRFVKEQVRLTPFDEATALQLMAQAGIDEARGKQLFESTQGYPFLLSLVIEESSTIDGNSALFLRKFFDRTTRWMTPREQDWFVRTCYLDRVNEDTLAPLFPGEDVRRIQDWFEKEPSIRDPAASFFRVRPLIRDKVLRYQEVRAPSRHRELLAAAGSAG